MNAPQRAFAEGGVDGDSDEDDYRHYRHHRYNRHQYCCCSCFRRLMAGFLYVRVFRRLNP